ncbi:hypothetical protein [Spirillospora sp. CA-294931]|uniref:hypothetical protein n=1 Tax=Spirillospora sp. CA-294931 TaxID=3240042 RepID=UPI003D8DF8A5
MTAVMLLGDFSPTGILRDDLVLRFNPAVGEHPTHVFIDWVGSALRERGAVIIVYPSWQGESAARLLSLSRSAHHTDRIAGVPLDLPPLALSLLADQLAFAAPYVGPGRLASLAHTLAASLHAGAWVSSVSRLEHIKTGLGSHIKSYLPSSSFSVMAGRDAGVHRITSAKPVPDLTPRALDPVIMITANADGDTQWLESKLRPALRVVSVNPANAQPMSAEYWGSKKFVEFVAFSGNPRALNESLAATVCKPCGWCGEPTALATCPFCAMVQPEAPVRAAPQPPPATAPPQQVAYEPPQPHPHQPVQPQQAPHPQQSPPMQGWQEQGPHGHTGPQQQPSYPVQPQPGPYNQPVQQPQQFPQHPQAPSTHQPQTGPQPQMPPHHQTGPQQQMHQPQPGPQVPPSHAQTGPQYASWPPPQAMPAPPPAPQPSQQTPHPQAAPAGEGSQNPTTPTPGQPKQAPAQFGAGSGQSQTGSAPGPTLNGHAPERPDITFKRPEEPKSQGPPASGDSGADEAPADDDDDWPGRTRTIAFGKSRNS